jgi:hypothetical protein
MSYDLFLTSPRLSASAFSTYFKGRKNYQSPGSYVNNDTGVYFSFEMEKPKASWTSLLGGSTGCASFNMNYFRPHVFGLEAESEVTAFVNAFACAIEDPQMSGMGNGPYSQEGFRRGWNAGNLFGYQAIATQSNLDDSLVVEDAWIESVWSWNFKKDVVQRSFAEGHFLPKVSWARQVNGNQPVAFCVWGEGVLTALPNCASHVLIARHKDRVDPASGLEVKLMALADVAALPGCEWRKTGDSRLLYAPVAPPPGPEILSLFDGSFTTFETLLKAVAADHVLDASLMAQVPQAK